MRECHRKKIKKNGGNERQKAQKTIEINEEKINKERSRDGHKKRENKKYGKRQRKSHSKIKKHSFLRNPFQFIINNRFI
jgi:hypothetical protein